MLSVATEANTSANVSFETRGCIVVDMRLRRQAWRRNLY